MNKMVIWEGAEESVSAKKVSSFCSLLVYNGFI